MTISEISKLATSTLRKVGIESAEIDVRVLISHVLKKDSLYFYTHPDETLSTHNEAKIMELIDRRSKHEPVAYLTGHKEFYEYEFDVNSDTLIPRPESEWLVEQAISRTRNIESGIKTPKLSDFLVKFKNENPLARHYFEKRLDKTLIHDSKFNILDIGTGSGCLIISLIKELIKLPLDLKKFDFYASDSSPKALSIAKKNKKQLLPDSLPSTRAESPQKQFSATSNLINFVHSDLFSDRSLQRKFDLIIANLPYVPREVKSQKSKVKSSIDYEPTDAIFAEMNGSSIIKKFIDQSTDFITKDGAILIELDPRNANEIQKYAREVYPQAKITLAKDLAGFDRYLTIENKYVE